MSIMSDFLKLVVGTIVYIIKSLISVPKYIIVELLPSLPMNLVNIFTKYLDKIFNIFIEGFSNGLLKIGDVAENIVNTIVESISSSVQVGSAVTSPLTLGVSGAVGVTISKILEFIITSAVSIIVAGTVIYITAYGLYTMLYYIFHLFAGIFIAKLLALTFVTFFIWVAGKVFKYFKPEDIRDLVFGIGSKLLRPIFYIYRLFLRRIRSAEGTISGGGNVINEYNYEIHIQFLTLFFSSILIIALLNKVYELYYEKEEEVKEEEENNND